MWLRGRHCTPRGVGWREIGWRSGCDGIAVGAPAPVLVIEPAPQSVHDESVDAVEYMPGSHFVHEVAPALGPVFVIEPAAQFVLAATDVAVEYLPAAHSSHELATE